jgi:hypothetical protein
MKKNKESAIIKFNNSNLALLCSKCRRIIKVGSEFNEEERAFHEGKHHLDPQYCTRCTENKENNIYVFGSNTEGKHGKGSAKFALLHRGAIYGQSKGLQGNSYAIITKDLKKGLRSVSLESIKEQVDELILFAQNNPQLTFEISAIGCGLAGFNATEIAPMFSNTPSNMKLNYVFQDYV